MRDSSLVGGLEHKNIIKYYDYFQIKTTGNMLYPCIATQLCEVLFLFVLRINKNCKTKLKKGDLSDRIKEAKDKNIELKRENILKWMCEAADGVNYLHSKGIIHRKLKPKCLLK